MSECQLHPVLLVLYFTCMTVVNSERDMKHSAQEIIAINKLSKSKDCYLW